MRTFLRAVAVLTVVFAAGVGSPGQAEAQPIPCNYCRYYVYQDIFCCDVYVETEPCKPRSPCHWLGCEGCALEEQEQQLEAFLAIREDGTLIAPGTALDGVHSDWLYLVTHDTLDGELAMQVGCGREVVLRAATDLPAKPEEPLATSSS